MKLALKERDIIPSLSESLSWSVLIWGHQDGFHSAAGSALRSHDCILILPSVVCLMWKHLWNLSLTIIWNHSSTWVHVYCEIHSILMSLRLIHPNQCDHWAVAGLNLSVRREMIMGSKTNEWPLLWRTHEFLIILIFINIVSLSCIKY